MNLSLLSAISREQNNMTTTTSTVTNTSNITRKDERIAVLEISMRNEALHTPRRIAIALIYSEALRSGAGKLSREKFLDAESKLGSSIQTSADSSRLHISVRALDTTVAPTLLLLKSMLLAPQFAAREIVRIQELLKNALLLEKENARSQAYINFLETVTEKTDPRRQFQIDVLISELKKVTSTDIKKLHREFLDGEWLYTCGGSETTCSKLSKRIEELRKKFSSREKVAVQTWKSKSPTKRVITLADIPSKQNIEFSIGNALPMVRNNPDFPAFVFGISVLALWGSFTGRLLCTVREKEGLTYVIYGKTEGVTMREEGFWRIMTFFNKKDAVQGITSTLREITKMHAKGITQDELKRFKAILHTRYALIDDSLMKRVHEAQNLKESGMTEVEYVKFKDDIKNMTLTRVNTAMKKYLNPKNLVISGAGPTKGIEKELQKFVK